MTTISSSTTSTTAYKVTADTTGTLVLQTGATPTTAVTIDTSQNTTFAGTVAGTSFSGSGASLTALNATNISTGTLAAARLPTGSVLQVVSTTKTNTFSTTSSTFTDITGLSVSITPSSASNKILIFANFVAGQSSSAALMTFNLLRGSTNLSQPATSPTFSGTMGSYITGADTVNPTSINFLDSPATTSSTTYKIQCKTNSGTTMYINQRHSGDAAYTSTITVMEIAA